MEKLLKFSYKYLLFSIFTCGFLQVLGQAMEKPFPTNDALLQLVKKHIHTPIRQVLQSNGDIFLQRDFSEYLEAVPAHEAQALEDNDFGHDHRTEMLQQILNRPHPSVATLEKYFSGAAAEFGVPLVILKSYAQVQSNWAQVSESMYGSWGIMGLVENNMSQQITLAATLLNTTNDDIKNNAYNNIRAAAALLAHYQKKHGEAPGIEDWFESVCDLTGIKEKYLQQSLAQRIYKVIQQGSKTASIWGEIIFIQPTEKTMIPESKVKLQDDEIAPLGNGIPDFPNAIYNLTTCNFNSRPAGAGIKYYFVHYIATGTYEGTISWFKNCSSQVSAHYVVRNSDGQVTQMVDEEDRAWSQGVTEYNDMGIGVEHDIIVTNLSMWDNTAMLGEAGKLAADVCNRNGIPKQRRVNNGELGIYGHSDVRATDCPNLTQERWNVFLQNVQGALPAVGTPTLFSITATSGSSQVTATWKANNEPTLLGYRLYYATNDALSNWALAANEVILTPGTTSITLQPSQFVVPPTEPAYHFRLTAVVPNGSEPLVESGTSDVYSRSWLTTGPKVLIVDGFDRISGSYKGNTHAFATSYMKAIRNRGLVEISTAANEKIADGTINLSLYDIVVWFVGDESSADVVFSAAEKTALINYLNNGGKLLVSGSEIAYNLGRNGAAAIDLNFMNNYLKATYVNDGTLNYTPATGTAGSPFEGLHIPFGVVYAEDFPDAIGPTGGSVAVMDYSIAPNKAGIAYQGTFGGNVNQGAIIYLSFPLETASDINMSAFMQKALPYFGVDPIPAPPITFADSARINKGRSKRMYVLDNDASNGNTLNPSSLLISKLPLHGQAKVHADGTITYEAKHSFTGKDTFAYKVASTQGLLSNASEVALQIEDAEDCATNPAEVDDRFPLRDLRGAWVTSVFNLDWPTNRLASPATQQAELLRILDTLRNTGFNSVFLQVRTGSDALYNSAYEPWSYYLTGTEGQAPSPLWDPLQFAIDAAHARGLELHAWINPYRARTGSFTLAANHVINQNPDWILNIGTSPILNPGLPEVRAYLAKIMADIASRYDVDGVHFDDYFYPSAITAGMQDAATYANYNQTGIATIEDWRRDNVNKMIAMVYDTIQYINIQNNRNVVFGVSPFGIWKSGTPAGIIGQSSYSALYCDPIAWMQAGKVDYVAPQLYWKIVGGQDYDRLSQWWNDQGKLYNRPIYTGQAWYKMVDANNWAASEIEEQIKLNRLPVRNEIMGEIGYRTGQIMANSKGLKTTLQQGLYRYKSYAPAFPWKDAICPNAPTNVRLDGDTLRWDKPAAAADGDTAVKYVVYKFYNEDEAMNLANDGTKVIDIVAGNKAFVPVSGFERFVVTALDKNNNESPGTVSTLPDIVICPGGSTVLPAMISGNSFKWQVFTNGNWEALNDGANFSGTNTANLSIINLPVSYYGTLLRSLADASNPGPVYTLKLGTTWTGSQNTNWHNAGNWSCGIIPTIAIDAIIHGNVSIFPLIESPDAAARSVILRSNGQLQITPGIQLQIGQQ